MVKLLPTLFLITSFTLSAQSDVRYFRSEEDFLAHVELPERKLGWWSYIEAHYDEQGRVERKLYFKRKGKLKQYQVMQYDSVTSELASRTLLNADSLITSIFTFGRRQEKINDFLRYRAQIDSVQDEGDRFMETILSPDEVPQEYRLYEVDGTHLGTITQAFGDEGMLRQENWLTHPDENIIRRFLYNYAPEAGMTQILEYDSSLVQVNELWVLADGSSALISADFPKFGTKVNSPRLSYSLIEDLDKGSVSWEWLAGTKDSLSPHIAELITREKQEGIYKEIVLGYAPELVDGAFYRITLSGTGVSGYPSIDVVLNSVGYDITPPKYFVSSDSVIPVPEVNFTASEPLSQIELNWHRFSSELDSTLQNIAVIWADDLFLVISDTLVIGDSVGIEDGERYDLRVTGWDLAGNQGESITIPNIRYDATKPQFLSVTPDSGDHVNLNTISFELSERFAEATLLWRYIGGKQDSVEVHEIALTESNLKMGIHTSVPDSTPPDLVDGALYNFLLWGRDFSGNLSDTVLVTSVTYDTTAPVVEIMLPRPADAVKNAAVTYIASEPLSSAEIIWSEMVFDTTTITFQIESLSGDELKGGLHEYPGLPKGGRLRNGNRYILSLAATDLAGNEAEPFYVDQVRFDTTGPFLADLLPKSGKYVQDGRLSFYVDEDITQGLLTWKQTAGEYDPDSPHQVSLEGEELKAGEHVDMLPTRGANLHDGSIYDLTFIATDRAGNSSNILSSDSIHYDVTSPQFSIHSPMSDNYIMTFDVEFTVDEILEELTMEWIWSGGSSDTSSPHLLELPEEFRQPGRFHFKATDSVLTLFEGATYDIVLAGSDRAGNEAISDSVNNLTYDAEAPLITWSIPVSSHYITGSEVSYELSENLIDGEILWEWEGGKEDPLAPHKVSLTDEERSSGPHSNFLLQESPMLVDGAIYSIRMEGIDAAGNEAIPVEVNGIQLDITPPEITVLLPTSYSAISTSAIDYSISEEMVEGDIIWRWNSGKPDPKKVHRSSLTGEELESGKHITSILSHPFSLVDGAIYNLEIKGKDFAGNNASGVFISEVYYDAIPPEITDVFPINHSHVNHYQVAYTLSENVQAGSITWEYLGGIQDELAPHVAHLNGEELNKGKHSNFYLGESPLLNDGSIYSISFAVSDVAGNEAETVVIDSVQFDLTNPEVAILSPQGNSWVSSTSVGFGLSENLKTAHLIWEWIGGSDDPNAPHTALFMGSELSSGIHEKTVLSKSPLLIEGAIYDLTLEGEDFAGNSSLPAKISALGYDATNPVISDLMPADGSFVNQSNLSYNFSEDLAAAKIIWMEKGPNGEVIERYETVLNEMEREAGSYLSVILSETPELKDGSSYDISFEGEDAAGNSAQGEMIVGINYDLTPPDAAFLHPESGLSINSSEIAYKVSEDYASANVVWSRKKGNADPNSPHIIELSDEELDSGEHPIFLPAEIPDLVDGTVYEIEINGKDKAGNSSSATKVSNIHFDATSPIISGISPVSGSHINNSNIRYELSENVKSGQILFERTGGSDDPDSPHIAVLSNGELMAGVHLAKKLTSSPELVDGAKYRFSMSAIDSAGNEAEPISVNDVLFDVTLPLITVWSPTDGAFLQSTSLAYELSETCAFGKAVWTWLDGTEDPAEIHTQLMAESELLAGEHDGNLGNRVELIDGAIYRLEITVQDLTGNESEPVIMGNLYYDATPPELTITAPTNDEIVNHTTVSYSLSEELQSAVLKWEAVGGAPDISESHKAELIEKELSAGKHNNVQLAETPSLNDGTVYRISFVGIDKAGNVSDTVRVEGIQYDVSPPELTILYPVTNGFINTNILSYSISEPLTNGRLIWTAISGDVDPAAHVVPLVFEEMSEGDHSDVKLMQAPRLSDGIVYDLSIFGMDLAGNKSDTSIVANLTFDSTPPRVSIVEPVSGASRNSAVISYKLSEDLIQGSVTWTQTGGAEDMNSPHLLNFSIEELKRGDRTDFMLSESPVLQDGAIYSLEIKGEDAAGNETVPSVTTDLKYDITLPVMAINSPLSGSSTNRSFVDYNLSEPLKSGQIKWKWASGKPDIKSPHMRALSGAELALGDHIGLGTERMLLSGGKYDLTLTGTDKAGNEGETIVVKNVSFDNDPPQISVAVPIPGEYIRESSVSYTLSEELSSGIFLWEQKSGRKDLNAPHRTELIGKELSAGEHSNIILQNSPVLTEGAIYDVTFTGIDAAGNRAEELMIPVVGFDSKSPSISLASPNDGSRLNEWFFDYSLSEDLLDGKVTWNWQGGIDDPNAPFSAELSVQEKTAGNHSATVFTATPALVDGAIYRVTLSGRDRADNQAEPVTIENLTFDVTPPYIVANRPAPMTTVNNDTVSFSLSEILESGKIVWSSFSGFSSTLKSSSYSLTNEQLQEGLHENISTESYTFLKSGVSYSVSFEGEDLAGNKASGILAENITFDDEIPVLTLTSPTTGSSINKVRISYNLGETLSEGKLLIKQTGGLEDTRSPYSIPLSGEQLMKSELLVFAPAPQPNLVHGSVYQIIMEGEDLGGNKGTSDVIREIEFDSVYPEIALSNPAHGEFINSLVVSYNLSESLAEGKVILERTGGEADPTRHIINLSDKDKSVGEHLNVSLAEKANLVDGSIYSLWISASDAASNESQSDVIENITFDLSKPLITQVSPVSVTHVNHSNINYTSSETLEFMEIIWEQIAGESDTSSPHTIELAGEDLTGGRHENLALWESIPLNSGTIYSMTIRASDLAGNEADIVKMNTITYDVELPILALNMPLTDSYINNTNVSYSLSEKLAEATLTWTSSAGISSVVDLTSIDMSPGSHEDIELRNVPQLTDGETYELSLIGVDLAGNSSEKVIVTGVKYDVTKPTVILTGPEPHTVLLERTISFRLSEDIMKAVVIWSREAGVADPNSPHRLTIQSDELTSGDHDDIEITGSETIQVGTIYAMAMEGEDLAGNKSRRETIQGLDIIRDLAGEWLFKGALLTAVWRFSDDGGFTQGVMMGSQISNVQPGRFETDFSTKPFELIILYDDGVKRFSIFEFLGNDRIRVVTSQDRPKSWSDGDLMEFEFNPAVTP